MQIVLLFDSKSPELGLAYGWGVCERIFKTQILQRSRRHLNIAVGDINIFGEVRTWNECDMLSEATYFGADATHLLSDRVRATYRRSTVYAWRIDGIDETTALALHAAMFETSSSYLGFQTVDGNVTTHRRFYINQLLLWCRIHAAQCVLLTDFNEKANDSWFERGTLRQLGFTRVRRRIGSEWWYENVQP